MGCGQKGVAADQRAAAPARGRFGIASDQKSSGCRKVVGIEAVDDARLDGISRGRRRPEADQNTRCADQCSDRCTDPFAWFERRRSRGPFGSAIPPEKSRSHHPVRIARRAEVRNSFFEAGGWRYGLELPADCLFYSSSFRNSA